MRGSRAPPVHSPRLGGDVEGRNSQKKDLDRLDPWIEASGMRFNKPSALGSPRCSGIGDEWLESCWIGGAGPNGLSQQRKRIWCKKMLLEGRLTSCRIPVVKLKHSLDVMRNKRREVQCVTIYGMMVILLPEQIFNLYPAQVVDS